MNQAVHQLDVLKEMCLYLGKPQHGRFEVSEALRSDHSHLVDVLLSDIPAQLSYAQQIMSCYVILTTSSPCGWLLAQRDHSVLTALEMWTTPAFYGNTWTCLRRLQVGLSGFRPVPGLCEGRNGMWKADCHTLPVHPWFHRQEAWQVTIRRMMLSYRAPTLCFSTSQTSLFTTSRRCFVSIHRGLIAGCLAA